MNKHINIEKDINSISNKLNSKKNEDVEKICENRINICKSNLTSSNEYEANKALIFAIAYKTIKDFTELAKFLEKGELQGKDLEKAWEKHWDCRDRLNFTKKYIESGLLVHIEKKLDNFLQEVEEEFGEGVYASVEFKFKEETCSICENDIRGCEHIKGEVYRGRICKGIKKNPELQTVSLVENPFDPRCRVWPWNRGEGDRTFNTMIASFFEIDDFLLD